jgi:hypothetical protein
VAKDVFVNFKYLRKANRKHIAVNGRGNAGALLRIEEQYGLKISLK